MSKNDRPIRLSENLDALLRHLYSSFRIPRDQYKKRPEDLAALEKAWRDLSGRNDSGVELVRYIQNQQKAKQRLAVPWPTFDGTHRRAPAVSGAITIEDLEALKESYSKVVLPLGIGTDAAIWNEGVTSALAKEFTRFTGKILPGIYLLAIAEEKRKRGLWFKVGKRGIGFDDLGKLDRADGEEE